MFRKNVFFSQIVLSTGAKRYFCISCWSEISRLHSTSLHFARNDDGELIFFQKNVFHIKKSCNFALRFVKEN